MARTDDALRNGLDECFPEIQFAPVGLRTPTIRECLSQIASQSVPFSDCFNEIPVSAINQLHIGKPCRADNRPDLRERDQVEIVAGEFDEPIHEWSVAAAI